MKQADAAISIDRRSAQRAPVNLSATVIDGANRFDCTIDNLSSTGAKLIVPLDRTMPTREFDVSFNEGNIVRRAIIMWRLDHMVGVKFLEATSRKLLQPEASLDVRVPLRPNHQE